MSGFIPASGEGGKHTIIDYADALGAFKKIGETLRGLGTLNANAKLGRFMHENTMERLGNKLETTRLTGVGNQFVNRRNRYAKDAQSIGDIARDNTRLRSIASNLNALNSQVV